MIAQVACFTCLQGQIKNFSQMIPSHNLQSLQTRVEKNLSLLKQSYIAPHKHDNLLTPPQIAIDIYKDLATTLQNDDPYAQVKQESIEKAFEISQEIISRYPAPKLKPTIHNEKIVWSKDSIFTRLDWVKQESIEKAFEISQEIISRYPAPKLKPTIHNEKIVWSKDSIFTRLDWAVRMAILGNVIDYGSQHSFSFDNADFDFKSLSFGVYDIQPFISKLESAKSLLYIADNAGENIFDTLLIATLKAIYPHLSITYAVRGRAIINDLTLQDMLHPLAQPLVESCEVLSSGVRSPGFVYADANNQTQQLYDRTDMILAKGTLLIATLKAIYPHLSITYAVRGRAIINDLTLQDMLHPLAQPLVESCEVLSSGVRSPGFVYADANNQTQQLYDRTDMILAKGMGNFECLESCKDERLFLLFKIKCDVVAKFCNKAKGTMMFLKMSDFSCFLKSNAMSWQSFATKPKAQ